MVAALSLLAIALGVWAVHYQRMRLHEQASIYGQGLSQYAVGMRNFVASVQGGSIVLPGNTLTATGVDWLKPTTCPGGTQPANTNFLPCEFNGGFLGSSYSTTITRIPATNKIEARTFFVVPRGDLPQSSMGVMAADVAEAALAQQTLPANGTFYSVFANVSETSVDPNAASSPSAITAANRGKVLMIVSNDASNDVFLRTDGTNKMLAALNVGGNDIVNARNGTFTGNLDAMSAELHGNLWTHGTSRLDGDVTANSNLTVAGNSQVNGTQKVNGALTVGGGANVTGDATVTGKVEANDVAIDSVGFNASQGIYQGTVFGGYQPDGVTPVTPLPPYLVAKPVNGCPGGAAPQLLASLQGTGASSAGDPLVQVGVTVDDLGGSWRVHPYRDTVHYDVKYTVSGNNVTVNMVPTVTRANDVTGVMVRALIKCP